MRRVQLLAMALGLLSALAAAQESGSISGVVTDDYGTPVEGARVSLLGREDRAVTDARGNYRLSDVPAGKYTIVVAKEGHIRRSDEVVVEAGRLRDLDILLALEFTVMEEFIVQDIELSTATEAGLLELRAESPALLDSVSADFISRAGVGDAAGAVRLIAGATVKDGKSAVIRGLPDRYVSSQLNGVRLPTSDQDKRAVELDQFPSSVIETVIVSKTFTPDQQGDASGGAVNVKLKGIPEDPLFLKFSSQVSFNTQAFDRGDFLSYRDGGVNFFGIDDGRRDPQTDLIGMNWEGAVGVSEVDSPVDSKWNLAFGGNHEFSKDFKIGGTVNLFYERDSSYYDNGIRDDLWVFQPGQPLTPRTSQGSYEQLPPDGIPGPPPEGDPSGGVTGDFLTSLYDIRQGTRSVQWGTLTTFGIELGEQKLDFAYLYSRTTEDSATLAENTRGKAFFYPGFDPNDPTTPGHDGDSRDVSPYVRQQTLQYQERETSSFQITGRHVIPTGKFGLRDVVEFADPKIDWTAAFSRAALNEPDKRVFGAIWFPRRVFGPLEIPAFYRQFKPSAQVNFGNLQRTFKEIEETSEQYSINLEFPFEQWDGLEGKLRFGFFSDTVDRKFDQDTYSNFGTNTTFEADFDEFWSDSFSDQDEPIRGTILQGTEEEQGVDVDYDGTIDVSALYAMLSLPVLPTVKLTGGFRLESTDISVINIPEGRARWVPPGGDGLVELQPGDADVSLSQEDLLPSLALEWKPWEELIIRAAYNETIARQTFKEITPIQQQEFFGDDIFIGNPELRIASVTNYDLRVDWKPYEGGLLSASYFRKDIEDPIEYVQKIAAFDFTTAVNYPEGSIDGFEFEIRQDLGHFLDELEGFAVGANATFLDTSVRIPDDEREDLMAVQAPQTSRDMTDAPEHLYNLYVTYDNEDWGTQLSLFYTVQGDTLLVGPGIAGADARFIPAVYAKEFGTLNFSASQRLGEHFNLKFSAKNLTNPSIDEVYRSEYIGDDVTRTSRTRGVEFSLSLSAEFKF